MKNFTFTLFLLFLCQIVLAQSTLFSDDFESYQTASFIDDQSEQWRTWSDVAGDVEDAYIVSSKANSGNNSLQIINDNDIIYFFGDESTKIETGQYDIKFYLNVASGKAGSFNIESAYNTTWDLCFNLLEDGTLTCDEHDDLLYTFSNDSWFLFELIIDIEYETANVLIDGTEVASWEYTAGALDVIDFYGMNGYADLLLSESEFYIDDFEFIDLLATYSRKESMLGSLSVYPNPATEYFNIKGLEGKAMVSISDITGKKIISEEISNSEKVSLNSLRKGAYFVEIATENGKTIQKLIKK